MNRFKRVIMNLGLKYVKPRKQDTKLQHMIKDYNLPDPLIFQNGEKVINKKQWIERRRINLDELIHKLRREILLFSAKC